MIQGKGILPPKRSKQQENRLLQLSQRDQLILPTQSILLRCYPQITVSGTSLTNYDEALSGYGSGLTAARINIVVVFVVHLRRFSIDFDGMAPR